MTEESPLGEKKDPEQQNVAPGEEELQETSLLSHLVELRDRLLRSFLTVLGFFVCLFPFSEELFTLVAQPLIDALPPEASMIATQVASPFLIPFKTTLWVALFTAMPVIIYQVWAFVAPGLYKKEKRFGIPLVTSSVILFFCGVAFAYLVVFPLVFAFFNAVTPEGVTVMTDISHYLDFILLIFFAFGLAFEVPIATVMLVWSGLVSVEKLGKARAYVFLGAFVAGMLLTPPDIISQTLLAVPIYLLYEVGIFMSRLFVKKPDADDEESNNNDT
ncbi:MAG: twin-arginine translocase subunit TatC [Pseudomonadota bacterium]|nr:twin-arginine translocase subunit TatC [Pseudomonadota bacterium]